jgi:uncharacterized protein
MIDQNVGKLVKFLRLLGYDTKYFNGATDTEMVNLAQVENRIILTRDTHILKRRLVTSGKVTSILILADDPELQIQQVVEKLDLLKAIRSFVLCLECNYPLQNITKEEAKDRVPVYVWQTQNDYRECQQCRRIYWKGTHWARMNGKIKKLIEQSDTENNTD